MEPKIETSKVSENIRKLRTIKGIKAETVAHELGITKSAYSDIETGKSELTLKRLQRIADVLGVNYSVILNAHTGQSHDSSILSANFCQPFESELLKSVVKNQEAIIHLIEKLANRL
ncbi:MAG: helix-turn-helix domain-containing protein [Agriterribacter sp.]